MNPYLIQNDILYWVPISSRPPSPGDVVIFKAVCSDRLVIHRVIKKLPDDLFITKGDNNHTPDKNQIPLDNMVGVVIGGVRGQRRIRVSSGFAGMFFHQIAQFRKKSLSLLTKLFLPIYHAISDSGVFPWILSPLFHQRLVIIKTDTGYDMQVYYGPVLAGWKPFKDRGWTIRPPYRIFLKPDELPDSADAYIGVD